MNIEIVKGTDFYVELLVDRKRFFKNTLLSVKAELLDSAITKLEDDIDEISSKVSNNKFGAFYWCYTYNNHRADGIIGTVLDYYIIEILDYLNKKERIEKLIISIHLKPAVVNKIKSLGINTISYNYNWFDKYANLAIRHLSPLRFLFKYFLSSVNSLVRSRDVIDFGNSILFFQPSDYPTYRLKGFPERIKKLQKFVLDESLTHVSYYNSTTKINISGYTLLSFFKALVTVIGFRIKLNKSLKKWNLAPSNIFIKYLENQTFWQTYFIFIRWYALQKILKYTNPEYLVASTNFGDPFRRMPLGVANAMKIKTILFACRPMYSKYRAEDRALQIDIDGRNDTSISDYLVVFDNVSVNLLKGFGINSDQIFVHNWYQSEGDDIKVICEDGLLILFAHQSYNNEVITLLEQFKEDGLKIPRLYFRAHPNDPISSDMVKRVKNLSFESFCITENKWAELKFVNVITFTSNSTSGIDAVSRGAALIWLPYLTEHSTQFKAMMDSVGIICNSNNEFFEQLKKFQDTNHVTEFVNTCANQFYSNTSAPSSIDKLIRIIENE